MEGLAVPPEIIGELNQILSNLVLGDNQIRSNAEKVVDERLANSPDLYLLALAQYATTGETDVMRSFSLVLLRRLLFRHAPPHQQPADAHALHRYTLYDHLSSQTLTSLEVLLLRSLSHEPAPVVRSKAVDTICDVANHGMQRGRPWHALQAQVFTMSQTTGANGADLRESAYRVFAGCPNLVMDLQTDAVLAVFQRGLQDAASIDVRHAALLASVQYLTSADSTQLAQSLSLMGHMLDTLPPLAQALSTSATLSTPSATSPPSTFTTSNKFCSNYRHLTDFLSALTPLCSSHPALFSRHLPALLTFLPSLILPRVDTGPTPTASRPAGNDEESTQTFQFPPPESGPGGLNIKTNISPGPPDAVEEDPELESDRQGLRLSALEFMISLSEAKPPMVKKVDGWVAALVRACLEGMGEFDEMESGPEGLESWLQEDPSTNSSSDEDATHALYEQSLDRLSCAIGGSQILPPAFQYIPSMITNFDWRSRHAGLMAVAAIAEGTGKVMVKELDKIVELVLPMFRDSHPRVRYAACQCIGQLCTDLEIIQEQYHEQLFAVLIPTLEDPEARVHSHAAAALINFCEGVERDTLLPYLDPIVERLFKLLNPDGDQTQVKRYVQEQVITTLAMVADASEAMFAKHYGSIMPLLLNVLRNADGQEYKRLRLKAMECAGLIAIAVGRDVFRPDANAFAELLLRLQKSPADPNDPQLMHYVISTWAKICQAMGPEFEPYLPFVMPTLLNAASAKADVAVYDDEEMEAERDGWNTIRMDGQIVGVRTAGIDEKCQAFETMVIYASTLGARFAPYLAQALEITLPQLRFYFHDGVREACAMLIPMLLSAGKNSNTLTPQMVSATFVQVISCISDEYDSSFLASMFKSFADCLRVVGGPQALPPEYQNGILNATKKQLQAIADRRRSRGSQSGGEDDMDEADEEDLALMEEMEDFALEDMGKMLKLFNPQHPLLVAISSVKDLGTNRYGSEDESE